MTVAEQQNRSTAGVRAGTGWRRPRWIATALAAVLLAPIGLAPATAAAEAPVRESDTSEYVTFEATAGDRLLDVNVLRSPGSGTFADISLYGGPEGSSLGSGSSVSSWTDSTFAATVELQDETGEPVGTVEVSGSYTVAGDPERYLQRYNDGNLRVVFDQTVTPLALSDVVVTLDGLGYQVGETSAERVAQTIFVSQPATYTGHSSQLALNAATTTNLDDFAADLAHGLDNVLLIVDYADSPLHASQQIDLSTGRWSGDFDLREEEGNAIGTVAATVELTDKGRTERFVERTRGGYVGYTLTPYTFTMIIDGPNGPATVTAEAAVVRYGVHTSPLEAAGER